MTRKVQMVIRMLLVEAKVGHHLSELSLINDTVAVTIHLLKVCYDTTQELLMFTKLKVEHALQKSGEL